MDLTQASPDPGVRRTAVDLPKFKDIGLRGGPARLALRTGAGREGVGVGTGDPYPRGTLPLLRGTRPETSSRWPQTGTERRQWCYPGNTPGRRSTRSNVPRKTFGRPLL